MKKTLAIVALLMGFFLSANAQYENKAVKIGDKAPELAYSNPDGKILKLSELNKGKYVLLDFWASWCGPCRRANPEVVKMYNEYSAKKFKNAKKGFTVVSFSLDSDKSKWLEAIKKDGLVWEQMADIQNRGSVPSQQYGIAYIPQCFLIGPDGNIIGKYNRAEDAKADLDKFVK